MSALDFLDGLMDTGEAVPSSPAAAAVAGLERVPVEALRPDPEQPRKAFDMERIQNLAESFKIAGILHPVLVRELDGQLIIVDGERRWRAAKLAGLVDVPVVRREEDAQTIYMLQVIANANRADLSDIETAKAIAKLKLITGKTNAQLAKLLDRSESQLSRLMSLIDDDLIAPLAEAGLIERAEHAAIFKALPETQQEAVLEQARAEGRAIRYQELVDARAEAKKATVGSSESSGVTDQTEVPSIEVDEVDMETPDQSSVGEDEGDADPDPDDADGENQEEAEDPDEAEEADAPEDVDLGDVESPTETSNSESSEEHEDGWTTVDFSISDMESLMDVLKAAGDLVEHVTIKMRESLAAQLKR